MYHHVTSRAGTVTISLLYKFSGYLVMDDHRRYNAVCTNNNINRVACWVKARWKFTDALIGAEVKNR
ncbi:MAG: transposase [Psychromonas sp.]|nr:transposase [Psychromonas sp.]